jgi:hypothetical protein
MVYNFWRVKMSEQEKLETIKKALKFVEGAIQEALAGNNDELQTALEILQTFGESKSQ